MFVCFLKPKGADRKLKTDREKIDKKAPQDREKYQSSHDTTLLKEVRRAILSPQPHYITGSDRTLCLLSFGQLVSGVVTLFIDPAVVNSCVTWMFILSHRH